MSNRTTKAEVQAVFERLCKAAGVPACMPGTDPYYRDASGQIHHTAGWSLDYASIYGGYTVAGHSGTGTSESRPLGEYRMPAGEFVRAMRLATRAIEASKGEWS